MQSPFSGGRAELGVSKRFKVFTRAAALYLFPPPDSCLFQILLLPRLSPLCPELVPLVGSSIESFRKPRLLSASLLSGASGPGSRTGLLHLNDRFRVSNDLPRRIEQRQSRDERDSFEDVTKKKNLTSSLIIVTPFLATAGTDAFLMTWCSTCPFNHPNAVLVGGER